MGRYDTGDIFGLQFADGTVTCQDCASNVEWSEMTEDEVIVEEGDGVIFCDRGKRKL